MKALSSVALRPLYSLGRFASSVSLHSHSSSPLFELLKAKGVLVARLNPGTYILCNSNNVIAKSTKIQSAMILSGFSILQKVGANKNNSGEVILSPKKKDDELLMFVMDGSVDYWVQKNSLLAAGSELNLFHSIFSKHYRVSGKGPLAFYGNGSIVKVTLAPNEESIVRKSQIIAWEASLDSSIVKESAPAVQLPNGLSFWERLTQRVAIRWNLFAKSAVESMKNYFMGEGGLVRVVGPGELYLSTKVPENTLRTFLEYLPNSKQKGDEKSTATQ